MVVSFFVGRLSLPILFFILLKLKAYKKPNIVIK